MKKDIIYLCSAPTKKGTRCSREASYQFNGKGLCSKHYDSALKEKQEADKARRVYRCHGIISEVPKVMCPERHRCQRFPMGKNVATTQLIPNIENGICRNYLSL